MDTGEEPGRKGTYMMSDLMAVLTISGAIIFAALMFVILMRRA